MRSSGSIALTHTKVGEPYAELLAELDHVPIDRTSIPQDRLDLSNRLRTSLFPWRGQFSPELIEMLLSRYSSSEQLAGDPFVGSGTALFEAARLSLPCFGAEINPAAVLMSETVQFVNLKLPERRQVINAARNLMARHLPGGIHGPLFSLKREEASDANLKESLRVLLGEVCAEPLLHNLIANSVLPAAASASGLSPDSLWRGFEEHREIIEALPYSEERYSVFHTDARQLPLSPESVGLILTSPPYINVFNYHQNFREAIELMGWNPLQVARSEIGSNRKNRGNRFLTVIQYCKDMLQVLLEMRRLLKPDGRAILVIGRESRVRGVPFQNGRIVGAIALGAANLGLALRQERKFKNKFGEVIFEDILHLIPEGSTLCPAPDFIQGLAEFFLGEALTHAPDSRRADILAAIQQAPLVSASPALIAAQCKQL